LYEKRQKRNRGSEDKTRRKSTRKTDHQELTRVIKALTQKLGKQGPPEEQESDSSSDEELEMKEGGSNRNNPALTLQPAKKRSRQIRAVRTVAALAGLHDGDDSRTGLDSHADTCVVGKDVLIVHDLDRTVNVTGYDPSQPAATSLRMVSAALAYDSPVNGEVIILVVHQAIHIPHLQHNLLSPMQLRLNDVIVNNTPRLLTPAPTDSTHTLAISGGQNGDLIVPLAIYGVSSGFPTRKPTQQEYDSCVRYDLTSESPDYDPSDPIFSRQEEAMTTASGEIRDTCGDRDSRVRSLFQVSQIPQIQDGMSDHVLSDISSTLCDSTFLTAMVANAQVSGRSNNVSGLRINGVSGVKTSDRHHGIDAATLARNWGIGLATAQKTLRVTTQRGVRTMVHPSLSRRFRTNDRQLRYRRLPIECFTDTLIAKTESRDKNRYAQVYCTPDGWNRCFPMRLKSEAHETLSLLHKRDGVPNVMIMDGSKEQILGDFRRKNREVGTHVRRLEPDTAKSNAAEGAIRELKKGSGRDMIREQSPRVLWDHCIERQAYVRSHTAHSIYALEGQVPETMVSGQTPDISPFAAFRWYEWVMFRDTMVSYPEDKMVLGRDLGPALDIGPAMTRKLLKKNGMVVYRSTVRPLTPDEVADPVRISERQEFDAAIITALGEPLTDEDLDGDPDYETPDSEPYAAS
jgi:hypothetical protein